MNSPGDRDTMDPVLPSPGYLAAHSGAGLIRRRERRFLAVQGPAAGEMLKGILTGRIPRPMEEAGDGWLRGDAPYSAILTPKGKMVTDLRLIPDGEGGFLLDLPRSGAERTVAHLGKYLNPRFARIHGGGEGLGMLTVVGPEGAELVSSVLGFEVRPPGGSEVACRCGGTAPSLWVLGNVEVQPPAMDLLLPLEVLEEVRGQMEEEGARPLDPGSWEVLRMEAATPLFGVDMTEDTIPVEAGIHHRAIDYGKGCYTGQEVIVRLRDRGQVNKRLCGVLLGEAPVPEAGTELRLPSEEGKAVGWVTSSCRSPKLGQTIALGYVRRRVEAGEEVILPGRGGARGRIVDLSGGWGE